MFNRECPLCGRSPGVAALCVLGSVLVYFFPGSSGRGFLAPSVNGLGKGVSQLTATGVSVRQLASTSESMWVGRGVAALNAWHAAALIGAVTLFSKRIVGGKSGRKMGKSGKKKVGVVKSDRKRLDFGRSYLSLKGTRKEKTRKEIIEIRNKELANIKPAEPDSLVPVTISYQPEEITKEEAEAVLAERVRNLSQIMPMTDEEYEDHVVVQQWADGRPFIRMKRDYRFRSKYAWAKRRAECLKRNEDVWKKLRLIQPYILRHPRPFVARNNMDPQDLRVEIEPTVIIRRESRAGFTYEDWGEIATKGIVGEFLGPQVGDVVEGKVAKMTERGAFVEIGVKNWAWLPKEKITMREVVHPNEVLEDGQIIEAMVLETDSYTRNRTNHHLTNSYVISMTEIARDLVFDQIDAIIRGEEGTDPILQVLVQSMKPFGAVVTTEQGLTGLIPNNQLANKVGDTSLVGRKIPVEIISFTREIIQNPRGPGDFCLTLSYTNAATKELQAKVEEGDVVDAKVVQVRDFEIVVEVEDIPVSMNKVTISGASNFELVSMFKIGQMIKAYVLGSSAETGEVRLSTKALERKKGQMVTDMATVFAKAEKTALMYKKAADEEKARTRKALQDIFSEEDPEPAKKQASVSLEDLDDDDSTQF